LLTSSIIYITPLLIQVTFIDPNMPFWTAILLTLKLYITILYIVAILYYSFRPTLIS